MGIENRAGCIVSRRHVNPIFPAPLHFPLFRSPSFFLNISPVCSTSPLLRISPQEDLVILVPDFIFGRCWISDPEPLPLSLGWWQTPLKVWAQHFGLLFNQARSCTRQLHSILYFDSGGHVAPQNFAVDFAIYMHPLVFYFFFRSRFIFIFAS